MEGIDDLIDKWGDQREIIMPQHDQQYSNAACNIDVLNSIGQGVGSSPQILPCELKYWHGRGIRWKLEPVAFIKDKRRNGSQCKSDAENN